MSAAALAVFTLARAVAGAASAAPRIGATDGRLVIALPDFLPGDPDDATLARALTQGVAQALTQNGRLALVDSTLMSGLTIVVDTVPDFTPWRAIGAQALVTGLVSMQAGRIRAGFRVWDTAAGLQLIGQMYRATPEQAPELARVIAAAIVERLAGKREGAAPLRKLL